MSNVLKITVLIMMFFVASACSDSASNRDHQNHQADQKMKTSFYYTCSMHPHIKEDKPGKCLICHMNLTKIEVDEPQHKEDESKQHVESQSYYTCSMHPHIREDKPGKCPICHMNLTKIEVEGTTAKDSTMDHSQHQISASDVVAKVKLRKAQLKHFYPDYFPVTTMKMRKNIRLLGSVLQSEEKQSNIPARVGGRVEKVYVKSTGSIVHVGDPVLDLYSPKLITAGEEYLLARQSFQKSRSREFKDMMARSIEKLKLWGIKSKQYEQWYRSKKVPKKITIYANTTGIVQKRHATVGKYFKEGQNFFELSDLSAVWIEMDVYEHEASLVKIGQKVDLQFSAIPGHILTGEIDFINPVLDPTSRTLKVRTTIENESGTLKPGMIADAVLNIEIPGMPFVVPRTAVIDTGKRKVVWVKVDDKHFQAKEVLAGHESEGYVAIEKGLMEGELVVIEGNFLLDAQAQLFGGYEDMKQAASQHNH